MNSAANILYLKFLEDGKRIVSQSRVLLILLETGKHSCSNLDELSGKIRLLHEISIAFDADLISTLSGEVAKIIGLVKITGGNLKNGTILILKDSLELMEQYFMRNGECTVREINNFRKVVNRINALIEKDRKNRAEVPAPNPSYGYHPLEESKFMTAYKSFMTVRI